ncbi:hypothetical protein EC957_011074 [Mortierella hygrophila]|uniref:HCP-like protein n=1 Tax=Mortierella hygrophila TaxID=979708 RepID=A0A9P6F936_9FUNG|nr:hypothetical protein EC957_011074 [Mortierella hygrophila]
MLQGNVQPQELIQAIRSVEKHIPPSSIPPPHPDEIFYVECHPDPDTQKDVVLWDDILQAFENAVHVRHRAKIVPFLKGKDLRILEPRRIAVMLDTVLDVIVGSKEGSSPTSVSERTAPGLLQEAENTDRVTVVSQDNITSTTSVRRNPVYGLVETAMENYTHIDRPLAFPSARGPHAALDDLTPAVKDIPTNPRPDDDNNSQQRGPQSATANVSMELQFARTIISAGEGDKDAQVALGDMYKDGKVVPQNYQTAMDWYFKAVEQGDAAGQQRVGVLYDEGFGVPQNYSTAMNWYLKSAEQGNAAAQYNIGGLYHYAHGVPRDYAQAMKWYLKVAEGGHAGSQYNIGELYYFGRGVRQDYAQAMEWYLMAASQGHALSQFSLGVLYDQGQGVPQDDTQAMDWFLKAAQ